jgi:hypothetical protein
MYSGDEHVKGTEVDRAVRSTEGVIQNHLARFGER